MSTYGSGGCSVAGTITCTSGISCGGWMAENQQSLCAYIKGSNNTNHTNHDGRTNGDWWAGLARVYGSYAAANDTSRWSLYSPDGALLIAGCSILSDKRIKTNIKNVEGIECLNLLRKLEPKMYEYIDKNKYTEAPKFGFIAQEIETIFPSCVNYKKDFIPNMFEKCEVINGNQIKLTTKSSDMFEVDSNNNKIKIKYFDSSDNSFTRNISSIIDDKTFIVDENIEESEIFLYGQEVSNYKNVDYTSIFSFVAAGVKELDKVVQEQEKEIIKLKTKNETLENRLASLEAHLASLESRLNSANL